jgi:prepilin-type N-terminal cleavage/methylation domain-containing protein
MELMKKFFLLGQRGYSMTEIMIVLGIGGIVALATTRMMLNMTKNVKTAQQRSDIANLLSRVNEVLKDPDNCTATVQGASGTSLSTTIISSIKQLDDRGRIESHPLLRVLPSTSMTHSTPTITGMYLKHRLDNENGADYDLWITVTKSKKGNNNTHYAQNVVSHKIPLQLDNCVRYMVVAPQNDTVLDPIDSRVLCVGAGGVAFGKPVVVSNSGEAAPNIFKFQGCRVCTTRGRVQACL